MNEKKKILVFIDWFLPGYKAGGPIRSVANLTNLLKNDFEFYIITRNTDYLDEIPYSEIESNKWIVHDKNINVFYLSKENVTEKTIKYLINSTDFETVYINGMYSWFFSILPLIILKNSRKKIVVCARGMLSKQAFSRKSLKKRMFLFMAKLRGLYKNIEFHATNENEKEDIISVTGQKNVSVIPNIPRNIEGLAIHQKEKQPNTLNLVSIARISQEKNLKFALEILSEIKNGTIIFDIYGSIYDRNYWENCKQIISKMPENITVNYFEPIESSNVIKTFGQYHFSLMPSVGENFGHSLLESMFAGTPVITSNNTPWKNLEEKSVGWDIDLTNIKKFKEVIQKCCSMSNEEYTRISENTFKFVQAFANNKELISNAIKLFA